LNPCPASTVTIQLQKKTPSLVFRFIMLTYTRTQPHTHTR